MCDLRKMTHCQRTVTRAYGGNLCHKCLQDRYVCEEWVLQVADRAPVSFSQSKSMRVSTYTIA